jgi:TRAP-type transport system periplasmic protein
MNAVSRLAVLLCAMVAAFQAAAQPKLVKVASVAPQGSIYHRVLQEMGEAYQRASGPQARFVIYPNSIQGTEADTVRRMRIGQLDASMLTVVGLIEIDPAVAALQYMPMMFRSWEELDHVREQLRPDLEAKLAAKGFVVLIWGEGGWVQFFTAGGITTPEQFRRGRIFAWSGDIMQASIMKSLGFHPVPIPLADALPALETGMVDIAPMAPLWAMLGQFDRAAKHMLRINWAPIVGATVMRRQTFEAMKPDGQRAIRDAADRATAALRAHRVELDEGSIRAMQGRGLQVVELTPELERAWRSVAEESWPQVRGRMVPVETFDRVVAILQEYRKHR